MCCGVMFRDEHEDARKGSRKVDWSVKSLPEGLSLIPGTNVEEILSMAVCTYNLSTGEMEMRRSLGLAGQAGELNW